MYQAIPKEVTPSGSYKSKQDLKICQVACGGSYSVARELAPEEGVDLVVGYRELEDAIVSLKSRFVESDSILQAWCQVRQERFRICKQAGGQVLVWGTGEKGELGLGVLGNVSIYPQPVFKFRDVCIRHVAAGAKHVLAVDTKGRLYSWGCGSRGRLGHGDFVDRHTPEIVMFFASLFVESCAAGDAHSAVLTTSRSGSRDTQIKRISTFGRGAHGRLGNGTNRNMCHPILVSQWLPSLQDVQFHQLACGGAHTLALASRVVPQGIANPRGRETFVMAWGYGKNGQLGTGYRYDSFVPVKSRVPKWELITEIAAGRSWSTAKTAGGEVYTWGKGLRGQLGQGPEKFCLAPRKIESFASFLHISSGYAHNVSIMTPKKFLSTSLTEQLARRLGKAYDPFVPFISTSLNKRNSTSVYTFDCCRRSISAKVAPWRQKVRFQCLDCGVACMCLLCAKICHRNHRILNINPLTAPITGQVDFVTAVLTNKPEINPATTQSSEHMSYRCSVMYLTHRAILRPKRGELEKMPRISILDLSRLLKKAAPLAPGAKPEVRRRNRESNKENEVNRRYLEVDRELHNFVKVPGAMASSHKAASTHGKSKRQSRPPAKVASPKASKPKVTTLPALGEAVGTGPLAPQLVPCCRCGVFNAHCKVIPMIPEHPDEDRLDLQEGVMSTKVAATASSDAGDVVASAKASAPRDGSPPPVHQQGTPSPTTMIKKTLSTKRRGKKPRAIDDSERDPDVLRNHYFRRTQGLRVLAARRIQRFGRAFMRRVRARKERLEYILLRREVCADYFKKKVVDVVFAKVWKEYAHYREQQELSDMQYEESLTRKYTYYIQLQQGIIGIEALAYGVRKLCGMMSPSLPRITVDGVVTDQWRPVYAHTYNSIRAQQLHLHPQRRVQATLLAMAARFMPRAAEGKFKEGGFTDTDIMLFTDRYSKDLRSENWRRSVTQAAERKEAMRKKIAAMALERLKVKQNATKLVMQQAEALTLKNNQKAAGPPPPPPGPPPRFMVVRASNEAKAEKKRKIKLAVRDQERLEDAEFSITHKGQETTWRARRHSIADPSELYKRVTSIRSTITRTNSIKRTVSLPARLNTMHMHQQRVPTERIEQVQQSLELFHQRLRMVKRVDENIIKSRVNGAYLESAKRKSNDVYIQWSNKLFQKSVLNPRLPAEMNTILTDGYRRRTIGEPERLARQLNVLMDTREAFSSFVESTLENFSYSRRRRSFDHGEATDRAKGIEEVLGFAYEDFKKVSATVTALTKDSGHMEQLMVKAKFMEATERSASLLQGQDLDLTNKFANRYGVQVPSSGPGSVSAKKSGGKKEKKGHKGSVMGNARIAAPTSYGTYTDDIANYPNAGGEDGSLTSHEYGYGGQNEGYTSEYDQYSQSLTQVAGWEDSTVTDWDGDGYGSGAEYGQLAHVWQEHYNESGQTYYYNVASGESKWEMPTHVDTQIETQNQDENGNWFWFNNITGEAKWM